MTITAGKYAYTAPAPAWAATRPGSKKISPTTPLTPDKQDLGRTPNPA